MGEVAKRTGIVGRLAPSPTGAQHVGNARTYLAAWLSARAQGGRVVLRIEDIDSPRVKAGADRQAVEDLHWLGMDWDEGPDVGGTHGPYVQTARRERYEDALTRLQAAERVYPCTCTRAEVLAAASAPHPEGAEPVYPGTCAYRSAADARSLTRPYAWRFRTSPEAIEFVDRFAGRREAAPRERGGDFVVFKSDGTPAYQLAVVVDDATMGITEVLRGDDLIPSTFRQLELYRFFGWPPPAFVHLPLVIGTDGRRLAKRHGDTRLSTLRAAGVTAESLIGLLAWSLGLRPTIEPVAASELLAGFSLEPVPRRPFVLTPELLQRIGCQA